jgi:anti-sigma factor RsiW
MTSCEHVHAVSTPYLDGELAAPARAAVDAHLRICAQCRGQLAAEREGRAALVACRFSLRALKGRTPARRWRRAPLAAALAVLCGSVLAYGLFSRSTTVMAAQLTLDHLKCVRFGSRPDVSGHDAMREWERAYGWRAPLPDVPAHEGFTLIGVRRCLHGQGLVAHALYRRGAHVVSLYVFPDNVQVSGVLEIMGERASLWSHGAHTYAAVGAADELDRFVSLARASLTAHAL